ncbi:hypothetical protein WICPIJ_009942, partial [Wickerhamomyces pijperi]
MTRTVEDLPTEVQLQILSLIHSSPQLRELKQTSRHFYRLINLLHKHNFEKSTHLNLSSSEKSLDSLKKSLENILKPFEYHTKALSSITTPETPHWDIIYSFALNRRFYFDEKSFIVQTVDADSSAYSFDPVTKAVKIDKCQSFHWEHTTYLPDDVQIFDWCICLKNYNNIKNNKVSLGLGTTKFEITIGNLHPQIFYPPTNISEILPDSNDSPSELVCTLKLGTFSTARFVPSKEESSEDTMIWERQHYSGRKLIPVKMTISDTGSLQKAHLEFLRVEFNPVDLDRVSCCWDYSHTIEITHRQNSINKGIIAEYYKLGKELEYQFHSSLERCIQEKENGNVNGHGHGHAVERQAAQTGSTLTLDESMIKGLWR